MKKKPINKKPCKCKDKIERVMPSFLVYQTSNPDKELMDQVFDCIGELTTKLAEKNVKLYVTIQAGVPTNLCGFDGFPKCP